ncbi:TetR family transcriptional regulator [Glaciihabitans tibetensis]|uniref:TetR family transcriptional regulator n=1 Tax=Glaciihabitans tibetensis TaxID=1266600 RepID=A0A2T0VC53_9MICO|nr:TetR family transcriptional regulator [Glaciihabitans tibetensis]PRY67677.1 TetR family transcriptional regulator [Glaciihabitans tibetensis]
MDVGVRELTRDAVRARLAESIYDCFLENGFDGTTVEEAAKAAGISRATFFRYFPSKEDAVIVAMQSTQLDYASLLRTFDLTNAEPIWTHLRRAFEPAVLVAEAEADPTRLRAKVNLISSIPSLRAHLGERRLLQEELLAAALVEKISDPLTAKVLVAAALSAFDVAWREWAELPDTSFRELLDGIFVRLSDPAIGHSR